MAYGFYQPACYDTALHSNNLHCTALQLWLLQTKSTYLLNRGGRACNSKICETSRISLYAVNSGSISKDAFQPPQVQQYMQININQLSKAIRADHNTGNCIHTGFFSESMQHSPNHYTIICRKLHRPVHIGL